MLPIIISQIIRPMSEWAQRHWNWTQNYWIKSLNWPKWVCAQRMAQMHPSTNLSEKKSLWKLTNRATTPPWKEGKKVREDDNRRSSSILQVFDPLYNIKNLEVDPTSRTINYYTSTVYNIQQVQRPKLKLFDKLKNENLCEVESWNLWEAISWWCWLSFEETITIMLRSRVFKRRYIVKCRVCLFLSIDNLYLTILIKTTMSTHIHK